MFDDTLEDVILVVEINVGKEDRIDNGLVVDAEGAPRSFTGRVDFVSAVGEMDVEVGVLDVTKTTPSMPTVATVGWLTEDLR